MNKSITLTYSAKIIRKSVTSFIIRKLGRIFILVITLLFAYTLYELFKGNRSWLMGVCSTTVAIGIIAPVAGVVIQTRVGLRKLKGMGDPTAVLEMSDSGFTVTSKLGSITLNWEAISEIWKYQGYWLLLSGPQILMTLPLDGVSNQDMECLESGFKKRNITWHACISALTG